MMLSALRHTAAKALDAFLPPLCLSCDRPVSTNQALCPECWSRIHFIAPPLCTCCGGPFETPVGEGMLCANCITTPPQYAAARAAMLYDDASKQLVLGFKHGDRIHPARALATWMHRAGHDLWADADIIIPVPLHRWRLFQRRYNQAALLAQHLGALASKTVLVDALLRRRATPVQGHMNRKERQANVHGAFAINSRVHKFLHDKNIILVDDVLTTGATVNECSKILLDAGARAVNVLTLARVRSYT